MPIIDTEPTPNAWLTQRLPRRFDEHGSDPNTGPWYCRADILTDDAALLRRWHHRLVADEHTAPAAGATYLASWIGGTLAGAVGHALATTDAGFLVDDTVRWHQHPDGWIDRVDLGHPHTLVTAEHPWRTESVIELVEQEDLLARTVDSLVTFLDPLIEACHRLARTGRTGLWNEVADRLGLAVAHAHAIPTRTDIVDLLARAVRTNRTPWNATPTLRIIDTTTGPAYIGQKGGCCLAYTCPLHEADDSTGLDDDHSAYLQRFPEQSDEPRYCTTCKFRDPADSEQRQRFWLERHHAG